MPFELFESELNTAKITRCAIPFAYCPLYIAPTPGISPRKAASHGLGSLAAGTPTGCPAALATGPAPLTGTHPAAVEPAPAAPWPSSRATRQGSQYTAEPALRIVALVNPLPHCWQNATRSPVSVVCPSGAVFCSPGPVVSSIISLTLPSRGPYLAYRGPVYCTA